MTTLNLIDRSTLNPFQELWSFPFVAKQQLWQFVKDDGLLFYPLALHRIESASFNVLQFYSGNILKIEKIFIQLEILSDIAHGWVQ